MNGVSTRYSSSRVPKNAQTCRSRPRTPPANAMGSSASVTGESYEPTGRSLRPERSTEAFRVTDDAPGHRAADASIRPLVDRRRREIPLDDRRVAGHPRGERAALTLASGRESCAGAIAGERFVERERLFGIPRLG